MTWDCGGDGGGSDESTDYSGVSPIAYVLITFGAIASCSAAVGQILLISEKVSLNHQVCEQLGFAGTLLASHTQLSL